MSDLNINTNLATQQAEHKCKHKPTKQEEQDGSLFDSLLLDDGNQDTDEAKLLAAQNQAQNQAQEQVQKQQIAANQQQNKFVKS